MAFVGQRTRWGAVIAASALLHFGAAWAIFHAHFGTEEQPGPEQAISLVILDEPSPEPAVEAVRAASEPAPPAPTETKASVAMLEAPPPVVADPPATEAAAPPVAELVVAPLQPVARPAPRPPRKVAQHPAPAPQAPKPAPVETERPSAAAAEAPRTMAALAPAAGSPTAEPQPAGVTREAIAIMTPQPSYPPVAHRRGQEGDVLIAIRVDENGQPSDVSVQQSSGVPALDAAAVKASEAWRFSPALKDGHPVVAEIRKPIRFRLTD